MRVIAGSARGRSIKAPPEKITRPTSDKLKGVLFSSLEALAYKLGYERTIDEHDAEIFAAAQAWPRVLDLYAGSGALAIEALSRGAESADLVETNRRACAVLEDNLRQTRLTEHATVHRLPVERAVSTLSGKYDLILADPPYADVEAAKVLDDLARSDRLCERAILVWEHSSSYEPPRWLGRLELHHTRRHGAAALSFYGQPSIASNSLEGVDPEHLER
jgi:16S rRNA (guanine966-N2)-methyltransferase